MGDGEKAPPRLQINPKIRLEFRGAALTATSCILEMAINSPLVRGRIGL